MKYFCNFDFNDKDESRCCICQMKHENNKLIEDGEIIFACGHKCNKVCLFDKFEEMVRNHKVITDLICKICDQNIEFEEIERLNNADANILLDNYFNQAVN